MSKVRFHPLFTCLMILLSLLPALFPVSIAANEERGNVTIHLSESADHRSSEGVTLSIVKAADINGEDKKLVPPFTKTRIDLNTLTTSTQLAEAADQFMKICMNESEVEKIGIKTDCQGNASISGLEDGIYLIYSDSIANYERIIPFLISMPSWNEKTNTCDRSLYIEPKHTSLPVLVIQKQDSNTKKNILNRDFSFSLYQDSTCEDKILENQADTQTGTVCFVFSYGTYYLKESKAPKGYLKSDETVKISYRSDGTFLLNDKPVKLNAENKADFIFYNESVSNSLNTSSNANTGVNGYLGFSLGICLIASGIILLLLARKNTIL